MEGKEKGRKGRMRGRKEKGGREGGTMLAGRRRRKEKEG